VVASIANFSFKFMIVYIFYILIWIGIWLSGFNTFYMNNFVNSNSTALQYDLFYPSLNGSYYTGGWFLANQLNQTQLMNLENGTVFSFCFSGLYSSTPCTLQEVLAQPNSNLWVINGSVNGTFYYPFHYNFYNFANNSITTTTQTFWSNDAYIQSCPFFMTQCNLITWINTKSSKSLNALNLTLNMSGTTVFGTITTNPFDVYNQAVLFMGFATGILTFSSDLFWFSLLNMGLFLVFFYCILTEVIIPLIPDWL
jgi:hypothetical protein